VVTEVDIVSALLSCNLIKENSFYE
jgi:hypothetical protein